MFFGERFFFNCNKVQIQKLLPKQHKIIFLLSEECRFIETKGMLLIISLLKYNPPRKDLKKLYTKIHQSYYYIF